jgi:phospholipase C
MVELTSDPSLTSLRAKSRRRLRIISRTIHTVFLSTIASCLLGCSSGCHSTSVTAPIAYPTPIQHVVVIMQENRSFDNLFNGFPGADTAQSGMHLGTQIPLTATPLGNGPDLDHSHTGWWQQWDGGKMDNFSITGPAYTYVDPSQTVPYWTLAKRYTLGDRMFQSNTGPSFVAHQYMIAGQSGNASENPSGGVWGCDAAPSSRVPLVGPNGTDLPGVYPCFDYQTMADLLDAKGITWRYYAPSPTSDVFFWLSAYQAIRHIRFGADWHENVTSPETQVLTDIAAGKLAQVTWIVPAANNSDHPGAPAQGPDWVASIVNAIGASQYWNSTTIFISWDDWGGFYDHVLPPQTDDMGLGFRVPVIVVSPYAKRGYVSHVTHESSGFLRYMEEVFNLPTLGTRDATADDFSDCFDYTQKPDSFMPLLTGHSVEFFMKQKGSGVPDTD